MCEHGDTVTVPLWISPGYSSTGYWKHKQVKVDSCISELVKALNAKRIYTVGSCCGHGKAPGEIILLDGRKLMIHKAEEK